MVLAIFGRGVSFAYDVVMFVFIGSIDNSMISFALSCSWRIESHKGKVDW